MEGHWKFHGEGESQQPNFISENMKLNWKFQGGGWVGGWEGSNEKPSMGDIWIFCWSHTVFLKLVLEILYIIQY